LGTILAGSFSDVLLCRIHDFAGFRINLFLDIHSRTNNDDSDDRSRVQGQMGMATQPIPEEETMSFDNIWRHSKTNMKCIGCGLRLGVVLHNYDEATQIQ